MNDRFRNLKKAHDHIVIGRSKEVRKKIEQLLDQL